ncbi:MAG: hypothetical protein K2Q25_10360 [Mycobacteriaceae bacterium]|nr:hypothetical protein [Mycobacteriaceae bacterium]
MDLGRAYLGDNLRDSSKQFAELSEQLEAVIPNGNWRGVAAQNYTNQVTRLSRAVSDLAELDNDLATCANQHGENVSQIRAMMGLLKDLCIIACFIEAYMAITDGSSAKIFGIIFGGFGVFSLPSEHF